MSWGVGQGNTGTPSRIPHNTNVTRVYLGLGSNLGDREAALGKAAEAVEAHGVRIAGRSSLYSTEPVGGPPQDWFLNAVIAGDTILSPEAVLAACALAEAQCHRVRGVRNGPRTLDADVLFYGALVRESPDPVIPHPRLHERRFVLVPLEEIAPGLVHPALGLTVAELLARCPDPSAVRPHAGSGGWAS
jgi:2-amino-4-hydroxy-6-hydroxymethyldihydropteridine diphosphokinase